MKSIQNKFDHQVAVTNLKENVNALLNLYYNGGQFIAEPGLICFINLLIYRKKKSYIIADISNNPIKIDNLKEFLELLFERREEVYNEYNHNLAELRKIRNPDQI